MDLGSEENPGALSDGEPEDIDCDAWLKKLAGSIAGSDPPDPGSSERNKMMNLVDGTFSALPSAGKRKRDGTFTNPLLGGKVGLLQMELGLDGSKRKVFSVDSVCVLERVETSKDTALWTVATLSDLAGLLVDSDSLPFMDHNYRFLVKGLLKLIEDLKSTLI